MSTYLEESLSMVGRMMLEDLFNQIDECNDDEAQELVEAHLDDNIFENIAPFLQLAAEEYEKYRNTPEGQNALEELKDVMEQAKEAAQVYEKIKNVKPNEGDGNVH